MGDRGTRIGRLLLGVIVGVLCVLLPAGPAAAHNSLTGSDPSDGAQLAKAPERVQLTFLSRLDPGTTKVTVTGPDSVPAQGGEPVFAGSKVTVPFRPGPAGQYLIEYEVASGDGHPVKGKVRFTLTVGSTPTAAATPSPTASPTADASPTSSASPAFVPATNDDGAASSSWWMWSGGGLLVLLAAGALLWRRHRRSI
ncbi:copper resistance CopC family protein [Micromonospora sonneratiae]|uniref:Copper resistance protein CopC n=1 Tax=Micromonospora sonneratiae TaxID=1184706 RepID=A0ABW3YML0_9ACTN